MGSSVGAVHATFGVFGAGAGAEQSSYAYIRTSGVTAGGTAGAGGDTTRQSVRPRRPMLLHATVGGLGNEAEAEARPRHRTAGSTTGWVHGQNHSE